MAFDEEPEAQDDEATAAAKAEIFGALDGSTLAEAEAEQRAEEGAAADEGEDAEH